VVLTSGPDLLVVGGLTQQGTTTRAVFRLDPVTGRAVRAGHLADPAHDAAGAVLGGRPYLFGGGDQTTIAAVQALSRRGTATVAGQLPGPRSDLSAVTLGKTAYILGGFDGSAYDAQVLATTDGSHFRTAARLRLPVRYAAVAGAGQRIWVFGGVVPSGFTDVIQQVNLATGKTAIVGHLPAPLSAATGFTLGGRVFIAGGQAIRHGQLVTSRSVLAYHPARHRVTTAGRLPAPVTNAAAAALGGTVFLIGGNNGQRQVPAVTRLRLVPVPAAGAAGAPPSPG